VRRALRPLPPFCVRASWRQTGIRNLLEPSAPITAMLETMKAMLRDLPVSSAQR
jgi:hypothetical protein